MKKMKKVWSLVLAVALFLAAVAVPAAPVSAQSTVTGADVNTYFTGKGVVLTKNLIVNSGAAVPTATFTFNIAAGAAVDAPATPGSNSSVYAGELPTTTTATIDYDNNTKKGTQHAGLPTNALDATHEYYSQTKFFDFTGANFTKPGIYRYTISEQDDSATYPAIDFDTNTYTLDVYIGYADANAETTGTMSVLGYGIYDNDVVAGTIGTSKVNISDFTFPNTQTTENLTISKTVTGTLGDKTKYFPFDFTVGGTAGYTYNYEIQSATGTTLVNNGVIETGADYDATLTLPTSITAATQGTIYLKDGQKLVIKEVPSSIAYTVTERPVGADGYTVTVDTKENGVAGTATVTAENGTSGTKVENTMVKGGNLEAFTNTKNPTPPTGIILQILPFALIVIMAAAGLFFVLGKKKHQR